MSKTNDLEDDIICTLAGKRGTRKHIASLYEYYLSGVITEPQDYIEWFDEIRNASENDQVRIYINSVGGDVNTALQFMRVLNETEATVTCSVEGSCMSAATMIFLCADNFEITPHSLFMFHNYSGGVIGKGGEIFDQAIFEREWSTKFLSHIYRDFLSPDEIQQLLNNKDIWLHSEEIQLRCEILAEARLKQMQAAEQE